MKGWGSTDDVMRALIGCRCPLAQGLPDDLNGFFVVA